MLNDLSNVCLTSKSPSAAMTSSVQVASLVSYEGLLATVSAVLFLVSDSHRQLHHPFLISDQSAK